MTEPVIKCSVRTIKTTAVLCAVVFLLCSAGCSSCKESAAADNCAISEKSVSGSVKSKHRTLHRRAREYSRIPGNYPANWQTAPAGY